MPSGLNGNSVIHLARYNYLALASVTAQFKIILLFQSMPKRSSEIEDVCLC